MPESSICSICLDGSFVVRMLVRDPLTERALAQWGAWNASGRSFVAPLLLRYEVTNAVHRYARSGHLDPVSAMSTVQALLALPIALRSDDGLHVRSVALAAQFGLAAAYDAHYLALAEADGAEFWTADGKLARAVRPALPWVRLLGEDDATGPATPAESDSPETT